MVRESSASETKDMVDEPDLNRHVFCRVLEDCGSVAVDNAGCAWPLSMSVFAVGLVSRLCALGLMRSCRAGTGRTCRSS